MVRSRWKGIYIQKPLRWTERHYQVKWWVKHVVLTEFFLKKQFKVYCGKVPHTVRIEGVEFLGSRLGEYVQTRVPFVHRRAKNKKKKDRKRAKVKKKRVEVVRPVRTFIKSRYRPPARTLGKK